MTWFTGSKKNEVKKLISQLSDPSQQGYAGDQLIALEAESVQGLIEALETRDTAMVPVYQQILKRISSATPKLVEAVQTGHPVVRGRAVEVLGMRGDSSAVPVLLSALKGEFFTVRARSALALANIRETSVISAILPLLKDPEDEVRAAACTALGIFREPSTFEGMADVLLDDRKIEVRQAAARAFGSTSHPAAATYLLEALHDSFWWYEREQAVEDLLLALENMGAVVVDPLIQALEDPERTVRRYAAIVLGRIGDPRAVGPLGNSLYDLHHEVGNAAAGSLALFGPSGIEALLACVNHPESGIRENAIGALGKIDDPRAAGQLIKMLDDPDRRIKILVIQTLGESMDPHAHLALQAIAADRSDRELSGIARQVLEKQ